MADSTAHTMTAEARREMDRQLLGGQHAAAPDDGTDFDAVLVDFEDMDTEQQQEALRNAAFSESLFFLFSYPESSRAAQVLQIFLMAVIALSVSALLIESLPEYHQLNTVFWNSIELFCIVVFTVDYVMRVATCPTGRFQYVTAPMNMIDFVAIAPFYVEKIVIASGGVSSGAGMLSVLRILRLLRVLRVLKLSRGSVGVEILMKTCEESIRPCGMAVLYFVMLVMIFSCLMYYMERGEFDHILRKYIRVDGSFSPFSSVFASCWWCVICSTTVGYGDVYPITLEGKLANVMASFCAVLVVALPISIVAGTFQQLLSQRQAEIDRNMNCTMMVKKSLLPDEFLKEADVISWVLRKAYLHSELVLADKIALSVATNHQKMFNQIEHVVNMSLDPSVDASVSKMNLSRYAANIFIKPGDPTENYLRESSSDTDFTKSLRDMFDQERGRQKRRDKLRK